jgi:hypothetical protein
VGKKRNKTVSARIVRKLLAEPGCVRNRIISEASRSDSYDLPDGSVLITRDDGSGIIWFSKQDVMSIITAQPAPDSHILENRVPSGKGFASTVMELIEAFRQRTGIPAEQLDFSPASLRIIDQEVFNSIGREVCLNDPVLFQGLIAYIGEIIRRKKGWKWEMRLGSDSITWEPWIVGSQGEGEAAAPFFLVFEELHESDAVRSFFLSLIGKV